MAEQLAFDQFLGNRGAVHLDERPGPAPAERMDPARHELLARAVLAVDQHAAVRRRRRRHLVAQLAHRGALADHRLGPIDSRPQIAVLRLEPALAQRVADDEHGLFQRQRLLDEVEGPQLDRPDRRLDVPVARNKHDLGIDLPLAQARQRRQTVHARQPDVENDQIDGTTRHPFETRLAGRNGLDRVAFVAQDAAQRAAHARLVVHDQNRWLQHGSSIVNRVPFGTFALTSMVPPCSAMIRRTMASPNPLPRRFVE